MYLHDYLKLCKHGYSKVTDHACREIRHSRINKQEGLSLVRMYENIYPKYIQNFCEWIGMKDIKSFNYIVNRFKNRSFWSQGTVAISKFDKNKLKPNYNFEKLSLMEEEHLLTKASIPYRDQDLNSSKDDIIRRRLDEQLFSNLLSTNKWREKWEMTKLSIKS